MTDIINLIMYDEELTLEDKCVLIDVITKASHGIKKNLAPGLYFNTQISTETGEIDIQLWYVMRDELTGRAYRGPANYSAQQIVDKMKEEYFKSRRKKQ